MLISSCPRATHCISINLVFTWKQVPRNGLPLMSCEGLDCKSRARGGISSKGNIFGILCVMTASIMCHWPVVRCCASAELWMKDSYMELNHFEKSCIRRAGSPLQSGAQAICRQREMRRLFCFIVGISLCSAIMWLFQFNDLRVCKTLINSMHPCQKRPGGDTYGCAHLVCCNRLTVARLRFLISSFSCSTSSSQWICHYKHRT